MALGPALQEEGGPESEGQSTDNETTQRWPITASLPKTTPGWRVDYRVDGDGLVLTVSLRPVLNRVEQLETYYADLRRHKAEVLEWLRAEGAGPNAVIEWRPQEAAAL